MSVLKTEALLKVNGQEIPLEFQQLLSFTSSSEVNKIPMARIVLRDGEANTQNFSISNQHYFIPGAQIELLLGDYTTMETVFKGIVVKHSLKIQQQKPSVLIVECKDESVKLSIGRKSRFFNDTTDADVFNQILREYNILDSEVQAAEFEILHEQLVQYYSTDWDFISLRAEAIGQYIFIHNGQIKIAKPDFQKRPSFALAYGEAHDSKEKSRIWEFESEIDSRNQFAEVTTSSWDYSVQELVEGTTSLDASEPGNLGSAQLAEVISLDSFRLQHQGKLVENELNALAESIKQKSILNKTHGRVKFEGRYDVKTGDFVELEGVGDRFSGKVMVSRVFHSYRPGRWFTEILFGLPYEWFHEKASIHTPSALGMLPPVKGLHIGKVIQLAGEGEEGSDFRIKVSIPGLHAQSEGLWARYANPVASNAKGMVFLPNIDDEVVIGYLDQDGREPIVLGSLYSESHAPPLENDDNNYQKGFVSNGDHRIVFDDENNTIQIETSGGSKVILDDGNSKVLVERGQSSIELSDSDISLKATNISIEATATIDIKGGAATNINNGGGGLVKLGNGTLPIAHVTGPTTLGGPILPGSNVTVLV